MAIRAKKVQPSKVEAIEAVSTKIKGCKDFIFTDYRGMTVLQITTLRAQLREKNAEYHVLKNNFARIAFEKLQYPDVSGLLNGPTAVAFAKDDSNEIAKIIADFSKESPVKVKGGLVEKAFFDVKQMDAYSRLPSRNQLLSMFMAGLKSPTQKLVYTLVALQEKMGGGAAAPEAAAPAEAPVADAAPSVDAPSA